MRSTKILLYNNFVLIENRIDPYKHLHVSLSGRHEFEDELNSILDNLCFKFKKLFVCKITDTSMKGRFKIHITDDKILAFNSEVMFSESSDDLSKWREVDSSDLIKLIKEKHSIIDHGLFN